MKNHKLTMETLSENEYLELIERKAEVVSELGELKDQRMKCMKYKAKEDLLRMTRGLCVLDDNWVGINDELEKTCIQSEISMNWKVSSLFFIFNIYRIFIIV